MAIRHTLGWVDSLRNSVPTLTAPELHRMMADTPGAITVVDIREMQERLLRGTIPGARSAPRGMLEFWADPASEYFRDWFHEETHLVVYCAGGARSVLAARSLLEMGYPQVSHLDEGFGGWVAAGLPTETAPESAKWQRIPKG